MPAGCAAGRAGRHRHGAIPARPAQPVLFLLDEFAALGRLEPVERAMGLMAGYGLQLWPILQDMHQLRALYGERAGTFLSNAGVIQTFGVNDHATANMLSHDRRHYRPLCIIRTQIHGSDDDRLGFRRRSIGMAVAPEYIREPHRQHPAIPITKRPARWPAIVLGEDA
jgi:hypothetical protein